MEILIGLVVTIFFLMVVHKVSPEVLPSFYSDLKLAFSKGGFEIIKKERHNLHYNRTGQIAAVLVFVTYWIEVLQIKGAGLFWTTVLMTFFSFVGNGLLEYYNHHTSEKFPDGTRSVRVDWRDIRFGGYGGWHYTMVAYSVCMLMELVIAKLL